MRGAQAFWKRVRIAARGHQPGAPEPVRRRVVNKQVRRVYGEGGLDAPLVPVGSEGSHKDAKSRRPDGARRHALAAALAGPQDTKRLDWGGLRVPRALVEPPGDRDGLAVSSDLWTAARRGGSGTRQGRPQRPWKLPRLLKVSGTRAAGRGERPQQDLAGAPATSSWRAPPPSGIAP